MRKIERISISAADRGRLERLVRDRNTPQKVVWRARIVLKGGGFAFLAAARYRRQVTTSLYPPGFIEPCMPMVARTVPTRAQWAYEIKHDGFRFIS